ncbi:hypothetical protein Btru_031463 [Bulinus truncatus]|nr:hypothetical protein Btru_031463 [Bulinus truncatus]
MMETKIFLQGNQSADGTVLHCPLSSSVIIFLLRYCKNNRFELVFVTDTGTNFSSCCSLKLKNLSDLNIHFSSWIDVPKCVQNVQLPSVHHLHMSLVRSGLCVILRFIIIEAHKIFPELQLIEILGFREGSMKMCSEVSGWTKLCEVDLPKSISELINKARDFREFNHKQLPLPCDQNLGGLENEFYIDDGCQTLCSLSNFTQNKPETYSDDRKPSFQKHKVNIKTAIDSCFFRVEQAVHFSHGVRKVKVNKLIDNFSKYCKDKPDTNEDLVTSGIFQCGTVNRKNLNGKTEDSLSVETTDVNISRLLASLTVQDIEYVHTYSEGIEMTLADLILFVYFYCLLKAIDFKSESLHTHVPNIMALMAHMVTLPTIVDAGEKMGWEVQNVISTITCSSVEQLEEGLGKISLYSVNETKNEDDEMELSRCAKMKHKALNLEVLHILGKMETSNIFPSKGEHPYGEKVHLDWSLLPEDVHPKEGDVPASRMHRKCEQLENLATAVQALAKPGNILVDFCSGGGHLGILMAYLLPDCEIYLVENKEESLLKACSRITSLQLHNVSLYQCNLDYFIGKFDLGASLHACGSATDMVLQLCLETKASFVVCPCCYGSIQKTHLLNYPRSQYYLQRNVTYKEYLTIGHAADQTEQNITMEDRGHLCMDLIDTDRAEHAKLHGYSVTLTSLKPLSCTPKSNLLIGAHCVV